MPKYHASRTVLSDDRLPTLTTLEAYLARGTRMVTSEAIRELVGVVIELRRARQQMLDVDATHWTVSRHDSVSTQLTAQIATLEAVLARLEGRTAQGCASCRHWQEAAGADGEYGACVRILPMVANDDEPCFYTNPEFGCVLHEARES
jgi:hypothetical protein